MIECASEYPGGGDSTTLKPEPDQNVVEPDARKYPDRRRPRGFTPFPDTYLTQLYFHRDRSGIGTARLLRDARDRPKGLNGALIESWLNGQTRSARPEYMAYVLARWSEMPDGARIPFTQEMRRELEGELSRTGTQPYKFVRKATDAPAGLSGHTIQNWLRQTDLQKENEAHWRYVMACLRAMPDAPNLVKPTKSLGPIWNLPDHRPISDEQLEELRFHRNRTGMGGGRLLNGATDKPAGLNSAMVTSWLGGQTRTALPEHLDYILARYRKWQR